MVQMWAEKEFRNLKRLRVSGIPCPEPLFLKLHVMLMSFIGNSEGIAAPRLKDARFSEEQAQDLYQQCIRIMRTMYQQCKLVHADFSEYNLLYHEDRIVVIDVSQSVEHDHPHALDFLRHDCNNVIHFFRQHHVPTLNLRRLFDFITDVEIAQGSIDAYLDKAHQEALLDWEAGIEDQTHHNLEQVKEQVFSKSYIPRTLDKVIDVERDVDCITFGDTTSLLYTKISGLATAPSHNNHNLVPTEEQRVGEDSQAEHCKDSEEDGNVSGTEESDSEFSDSKSKSLSKDEIRVLRKENKAVVKAENREKRKNKVPKHVKKRREKLTSLH